MVPFKNDFGLSFLVSRIVTESQSHGVILLVLIVVVVVIQGIGVKEEGSNFTIFRARKFDWELKNLFLKFAKGFTGSDGGNKLGTGG